VSTAGHAKPHLSAAVHLLDSWFRDSETVSNGSGPVNR
jgi:hypothetical protein